VRLPRSHLACNLKSQDDRRLGMLRVNRCFDMQRDSRRMQQRVVDQAMLDGILQTLTLFGSERHRRINANNKII
jgi:hypothetical protein